MMGAGPSTLAALGVFLFAGGKEAEADAFRALATAFWCAGQPRKAVACWAPQLAHTRASPALGQSDTA